MAQRMAFNYETYLCAGVARLFGLEVTGAENLSNILKKSLVSFQVFQSVGE